MLSRKSIYDIFMYLVIGTMYIFSINLCLSTSTFIEADVHYILYVSVGMILLFLLVLYNKYSLLCSLILLVLFAGITLLLFFYAPETFHRGYFEALSGTASFVGGKSYYMKEYGGVIIFCVSILLSLLMAISFLFAMEFYLCALIGALPFVITILTESAISELAFIIFFFVFLVMMSNSLNGNGGKNAKRRLILYALPLCLTSVFIGMATAPKNYVLEMKDPQSYGELLTGLTDLINGSFGTNIYALQSSGFSQDTKELGGPISLSGKYVMTVISQEPMYLAGSSKDVYTGRGWVMSDYKLSQYENIEQDISAELKRYSGGQKTVTIKPDGIRSSTFFHPVLYTGFESIPNMAPLTNITGDMFLDKRISADARYSYTYYGIDTNSAVIRRLLRNQGFEDTIFDTFAQSKSRNVFSNLIGSGFVVNDSTDITNNDNIYAVGTIYNYDEYSNRLIIEFAPNNSATSYLEYDIDNGSIEEGNPDWKDFLSSYYMGDTTDSYSRLTYNEIASVYQPSLSELAPPADTTAMFTVLRYAPLAAKRTDQMLERKEDVHLYKQYTALPDSVPERVYELAASLTEGYDNQYDKVKAIEDYLSTLTYTLDAPITPKGRDFVDYFLFDIKEGYCSYFASAFCVLSRCAGIPAKYSEGYRMPVSSVSDNRVNYYEITDKQAHAWTDVYFEGVGWVTFDATPPYNQMLYNRELEPEELENKDYTDALIEQQYYDEDEIRRIQEEALAQAFAGMNQQNPSQSKPAAITEDKITEKDEPEKQSSSVLNWIIGWVYIIIPLAFIAYILLCLLIRFAKKLRFRKKNDNDMVAYYYRNILRIANYWQYPIEPEETPRKYGLRMRKRFLFVDERYSLADLAAIYNKSQFSQNGASKNELEIIRKAYYDFVYHTKFCDSKILFWFNRYVFNNI